MTLKLNRVCAVVKGQIHEKYHQAEMCVSKESEIPVVRPWPWT